MYQSRILSALVFTAVAIGSMAVVEGQSCPRNELLWTNGEYWAYMAVNCAFVGPVGPSCRCDEIASNYYWVYTSAVNRFGCKCNGLACACKTSLEPIAGGSTGGPAVVTSGQETLRNLATGGAQLNGPFYFAVNNIGYFVAFEITNSSGTKTFAMQCYDGPNELIDGTYHYRITSQFGFVRRVPMEFGATLIAGDSHLKSSGGALFRVLRE